VRIAANFLKIVRDQTTHARILIIGGGSIGAGLEDLYRDPAVQVIGTDVYASENTVLVCDGHNLPFRDSSFDAVIVQAVLEHVLDPVRVVDEIHRVLKPNGLTYADTPFIQQVHEGAYDFTRFTMSGHRWLFRRFEEVESGVVDGPGVALLWSINYFARSLGAGPKLAAVLTAPFFWVRFLENFAQGSRASDGASSVYFIGRRSENELAPRAMPDLYAGYKNQAG
jgi:SAM-dependent methyltransferase